MATMSMVIHGQKNVTLTRLNLRWSILLFVSFYVLNIPLPSIVKKSKKHTID